ncbi:MAG: SpoIIAA family protein [Acidiferrobacterales bacterium]
MIVIQDEGGLLKASVFAEFAVADYRELENAIIAKLKAQKKLNLLLDLTSMAGFTLDVAWEDIKFTRNHPHDFARIAVLTNDQWRGWLGWLATAFTDAQIGNFTDPGPAETWARGH